MSLGEQSQKWFPTHVQATVLQAAGLSAKGKNGTNDSYTIIQVGKEKYSTSVAEKTLDPVWREEATFELPGLLVTGNPEVYELVLTVMHRSLVGMDKFLGQTTINLNVHFENRQRNKIDWYPLQSKPGTKVKDRGRLQVLVQFVRNNMTASMFDLSMKDKPRSPFFKLKHKIRGRKHDAGFSDTSSAILPRSALADSEQGAQQGAPEVPEAAAAGSEAKVKKRPLLSGAHRLSAAQSMSDLMGSNFRPKLNSMNSIEESRGSGSGHRRSTDDHTDPFADATDGLPQKYATLPRKGNPFDSEAAAAAAAGGQQTWDRPKDKKEKVSLLERVTGKKDGKKSNGSKGGSTGDLQTPNPFTSDTNPFSSNFKPSDRKISGTEGLQDKKKKVVSPVESAAAYRNLTFEEVVQELVKQKEVVKRKDAHIRELEDYIDDLLVRVMEETPSILRTPYEHKKKAGKFGKK